MIVQSDGDPMRAVPSMLTSVLALTGSSLASDVTGDSPAEDVVRAVLLHKAAQARADAFPDSPALDLIEQSLQHYLNPLGRIQDYMTESNQPDTIVYEVQAGDTLSEISAEHGVSMEEVAYLNEIENPHLLQIGQELEI